MRGSGDDGPKRRAIPAVSSINITPLIDVMLVLLILFMAVPPPKPDPKPTLDTSLARPSRGGELRPSPQSGLLVLDGETLTLDGLSLVGLDDLDARLRTRGLKVLFVRASGSLSYGRVVGALDVARGAGVERIGIVSEAAAGGDGPGSGGAGGP